jgi:hypothetical protein
MSFTCPRCNATSHHPKDVAQGYCVRCHEFTGSLAAVRAEDAEIQARLDRVDAALAKRVGDHIQRDAELRQYLKQWLDCYSTDIFPEPDLKKAATVLKDNGLTIDSLSAHMGRHILTHVIERLANPPEPD